MTFTIRGKVQGVFFRSNAFEKAKELGLVGYVRNRDDGVVEAVAEGDLNSLEAFAAWCKEGPPLAHVEGVDVLKGKATGIFTEFRIRP